MVWSHLIPTICENIVNFKYETKSDIQKVLHKIHYIRLFTNILLCLFCGFSVRACVCVCVFFVRFVLFLSLCIKGIWVGFFKRSLMQNKVKLALINLRHHSVTFGVY